MFGRFVCTGECHMLKKYLPAVIVLVVIGASIPILSELTTTQPDEPILSELTTTQPDEPMDIEVAPLDQDALSKYPRPILPPMNLVDKGIPLQAIKDLFPYAADMPQILPTGEEFVYGLYDLYYDEATLYYADAKIHSLVKNEHDFADLFDLGIVIIDYQRLSNLSSKIDRLDTNTYTIIDDIPSENKGYVCHKCKGNQLFIVYPEDGIELSIVKNDATPEKLKALVKDLDL